VLFFSSHEDPLFPGTGKRSERGAGRGKGFTINAPLPPGATGDDILHAWQKRLVPKLRTFKPELILISAGFDAHRDDPLADFRLETTDFTRLTLTVMEWANQYAQGRIVSVLEGGYNLQTLGPAVAAHVAALAGIDDA
jgi:acetoin utilization deacetylase AcuC-like enzyme